MLFLDLLNGLLIVFFHFVCKLLPNMRKHHVTTMLPKFFCLGLLTWKQKFIHSFIIDVNVELLLVFSPIHRCNLSRYTTQLILLGSGRSFLYYNDFWKCLQFFLLYFSALHTSLARLEGFSLIVTTHNSTTLKVNGMTEDVFICSSFWSTIFLYPVTRHKKELFVNLWANYGQSWMVGVAKAYRESRARSTSLKWYWKRYTCPSSSNRLNTWILFASSSPSIMNLWCGYCDLSQRHFVLINRRCIIAI